MTRLWNGRPSQCSVREDMMPRASWLLLIALVIGAAVPARGQGTLKPADWVVRLAPDGRYIELAYRGTTWVTGLRVAMVTAGKRS